MYRIAGCGRIQWGRKLSELYYYTITFTSAEKNIDAAQLLSKPAMLTMGGGALQQLADCKRVHGVITTFRRVNRSEDQSTYQITSSRFFSLLDKQFRSHRFSSTNRYRRW